MAISVQSTTGTAVSGYEPKTTNVRAMSIATMLFFMWGFLTCLNDILIPHLKAIFDLNYAQALLVQFCFFSSYFVFALPSGKLVDWRGYKQSMVIGLLIMAAGALLFLPAASLTSFPLFLTALVMLAAGITCLQVAANPYVANLGPQATSSSRLTLAQAFNSFGTFLAPFFGSALILSNLPPVAPEKIKSFSAAALQAYRMQEASSVRLPYFGLAMALILLAVALALVKLPSMDFTKDFRPGELGETARPSRSIFSEPHLLFGALGIFVYVGAEVSIGSFMINYLGLPEIGNLTQKTAALYVSLYWGGAMVGRFIGSWVMQYVKAGLVLAAAAVVAFALVGTSIVTHGHTAMWAIILVGLFNSVMFPNIFTLGLANLGELTSKGSSLMVAAIVGGAIIPLAEGHLADRFGVQHAFLLPAVCYIYIALYGYARRNSVSRENEVAVAA